MQLGERKKQILSAIVNCYIQTGEPVGSKLLAREANLGLSSATLRNEMSELAEMGYLEQPHTSAGRVPTQSGYRFYVDCLMEEYRLTQEETDRIDRLLRYDGSDLETLMEKAGKLLASLTGCAAVSSVPQGRQTAIRRVEIMPAGKRSMLVVILASSGVIRSKLCRAGEDLTPDMLEFFSQLVNENISGKKVEFLTPELLDRMTGELYEYRFALAPALKAIFEQVRSLSDSEVFLGGETNLLSHPGFDEDEALKILKILQKREALKRLVEGIGDRVRVRIGTENGLLFMRDSSLIAAPYAVLGKPSGAIGIIGPTRMDYPRLVSNIEYFSSVLSKMISEIFADG